MKMMITLLIMFCMFLLVGTELVLGASWSAYVLDVNNTGIDVVNVTMVKDSNGDFLNFTFTDTNGFFMIVIPGVPPPVSVKLISSKSGFLTDTSQALPPTTQDSIVPFNITLEKASPGNLSGRITDAGGEGIENANVSALQNNLTIASVLTNSSGHYVLPDLRDGTYDLRITSTGYLTQDFTNVVVFPGNITTVTDISPSPETIPPIISNVSATLITSSETVIIWQTDESANSSVDYYANSGSVLNSGSETLINSHMVRLSSLSSSTLYFYNVSSCDFIGNCNTSILYNFTTLVSTSSGGGGGGSGGGGGGGSCTYDENYDWECDEWSECVNDAQTRTCKEVNNCEGTFRRPEVTRSCILVAPTQLFDISLDLENFVIHDISELVAIATFENFGTEPTPVTLLFTILNKDGEEVHSEEHAIIVETEEVFRRRFADVDIHLPKGEYTFILTTLYHVTVVDEFRHEFEITGKKVNWFLIIGIFVIVLIIIGVVYLLIKLRKNKIRIRSKRKGGRK